MWSSRIVPAVARYHRHCASAALIAVLCSAAPVLSPGLAQSTDFATTTKTVTLPKGSKVDPRYLLRRKKQDTDTNKDQDKKVDPEKQAAQKLANQLDGRLLGAWIRVSSVSKKLTANVVRNAAKRCFQQLKLKPLRFETTAARQLPDIDALFGDLVYYRTQKGLQRLDINSGQIRLVTEISARQLKNTQIVWTLMGRNMKLRVRFSKPIKRAPNARFMLEESGFYMHCPSKNDTLFQDDG